jgi:hypothetical protein
MGVVDRGVWGSGLNVLSVRRGGLRQKEKGPGNPSGAPKSRSYDDSALHLLSSRLACLRRGSSNPYIGVHLLSDDPLAYSARFLPAEREGKTIR